MENLVTFIIPTYNAEQTIDRCLESVTQQTYKNLQIICCDDMSSDYTYEKLKEWQKKDTRVIVLKNEKNMRAAYSRNRCIEEAEGVFIAQIDDDDYCAPDRIEKQVDFLLHNQQYDFVGTGLYYFDEDGVFGQTHHKEDYAPKKEEFLHNSMFPNPSMLYKASAIKGVGGYRVVKETRRGQDYDLHMRLYSAGYSGFILSECLTYYYRGKLSYPKCKYEYRIDEAKMRYYNFQKLGLLPRGVIYVIKPLIAGLIPMKILEKMKNRKRKIGR